MLNLKGVGSHPEFEINRNGPTHEPRTVDRRPSQIFTMVGLLEGQQKTDRAVQGLFFLKFLLQLCAALKPIAVQRSAGDLSRACGNCLQDVEE